MSRTAGSGSSWCRWAFTAAYSRLAVVLVLTFLGIPFVVRTLQPVLESLDADKEEAAYLLGASRGCRLSGA